MKIRFTRQEIEDSVQFIRRCGYGEYYDNRMKKTSYMKRARMSDMFPRFHIYIQDEGDSIVFDLHLDQKRGSYEGSSMHSGEYEGAAVEREAERIRSMSSR